MLDIAPTMARCPDLAERLMRGERLQRTEALALATTPEVFTLGQLAAHTKFRQHADRAYFSAPRLATFTDARFTLRGEPAVDQQRRAPVPTITAVLASDPASTTPEWHLLVGEDQGLPFTAYLDQIASLRQQNPTAYIHGFTAADIALMADIYHLPVAELLTRLHFAGLNALDGSDALISAPRVRARLAADLISWERWCAIHGTAQRLGLSSAATMRCSAIETWEERVDHLLAIRDLQDASHSFDRFILQIDTIHRSPAAALDDLKALAISRLILDTIPHIVADTTMVGPEVAQTSLTWGVDTLAAPSTAANDTDLPEITSALQAQIRGAGCQAFPLGRPAALRRRAR